MISQDKQIPKLFVAVRAQVLPHLTTEDLEAVRVLGVREAELREASTAANAALAAEDYDEAV